MPVEYNSNNIIYNKHYNSFFTVGCYAVIIYDEMKKKNIHNLNRYYNYIKCCTYIMPSVLNKNLGTDKTVRSS